MLVTPSLESPLWEYTIPCGLVTCTQWTITPVWAIRYQYGSVMKRKTTMPPKEFCKPIFNRKRRSQPRPRLQKFLELLLSFIHRSNHEKLVLFDFNHYPFGISCHLPTARLPGLCRQLTITRCSCCDPFIGDAVIFLGVFKYSVN